MKTSDVVAYFGSKKKVADALGVGKSAITNWGENVPESRQYQIELITNGALKSSRAAA